MIPPIQQFNTILIRTSILLAVSGILVGCTSTGNVPSAQLPFEYRSQDITMKPPVDLTLLARRSINSSLLYPGDVVNVTIVSGAEAKTAEPQAFRLSPDGIVELPQIGPVKLSGMTLAAAEQHIAALSQERQIYRAPAVTVTLHERKSDTVRVVGAVNQPGTYDIPKAGNDLLAALTFAKGLTEEADTVIEIRHPSTDGNVAQASFDGSPIPAGTSQHVDLLTAMENPGADLTLRDGSVVMVKKHVPRTIYIDGLVRQGGQFELPKDQPLRVIQAVAMAKGRTNAIANKVLVTRFVPGREDPVVIQVSLREAAANRDANIVLMPNDTVTVPETPLTFTVDFIKNFARLGFSAGIN